MVVSDAECSLTMPLLFGLIALFVEMLFSSEVADDVVVAVLFDVDVFKMDSVVFTDGFVRRVKLEASPLPVIVPFTGVLFKNDILALRFCSATEDVVVFEVADLLVIVETFWKWSL